MSNVEQQGTGAAKHLFGNDPGGLLDVRRSIPAPVLVHCKIARVRRGDVTLNQDDDAIYAAYLTEGRATPTYGTPSGNRRMPW